MLRMILRVLLLISFTCCVCETFKVNVTQSFYQAEENHNITLEWSFRIKADTFIEIFCEKLTDQWAKPVFRRDEGLEVPQSQDKQFADQVQCDKDVLSEKSTDKWVKPVSHLDGGLEVPQSQNKQFAKRVQCDEDDREKSTDQRAKVLFHLDRDLEVQQSQDKQFAGRVQCDKDVLKEGRVNLHLSNLRIEDSGLYLCEVVTSSGLYEKACFLSVTARDQRPNKVRDRPEPQKPNTASDQPEPERTNTRDQPEPERTDTESQGRTWKDSLGVTAVLLVCGLLIFHLLSRPDTTAAEPRSTSRSSHPKTSSRMGKIHQVVLYGLRGEKVIIDLCNTEEQMRSMTVLQLKEKIAQKLPDTAGLDNLRLIFTDKALEEDTDLLSEYGIQHMSVIHIVLKVPGGLIA